MKIRAKMTVTSVTKVGWNPETRVVKMDAAYGGSPEDNSFAKATPSAHLEMTVDNPTAAQAFDSMLGKSYYVDFTTLEG